MKRILAVILCSVMLVSFVPLYAFAESETYAYETFFVETDLPDNEELFAGYVENAFYPEYAVSLWGISARDRLGSADKYLYDWLKENIVSVAAGNKTSTTFVADLGELLTWSGVNRTFYSNDYLNQFYAQFDYTTVIDALMQDCPYELYWFDKAVGYSFGVRASTFAGTYTVTQAVAVFRVCEAYQGSNYDEDAPTVAPVGTVVKNAVANAKSIVEQYASLNDYKKLVAYKEEICSLVKYNNSVVGVDVAYGDPWQLIYVFDNDTTTDVVCEGYSKAFKYLCDLSTFISPEVGCYSVIGTTNGGGHMWNILTMPDGKNYIADITNSDSGTVGQYGGLFLNGMSGSITGGYTKTLSKTIKYVYDSDDIHLWGSDDSSILKLSAEDYDSAAVHISISASDIVYNSESVTIGVDDEDIIYSTQVGEDISGYNITFEWYNDNNGAMGTSLEDAPVDVGTYWVKVIASGGDGSYNAAKQFSITPATVSVGSASCMNRTYDGTKDATVLMINLNGVYEADDVRAIFSDAEFETADVGKKTKIIIKNVALTGSDKDNYKLSADEFTVPLVGETYIEKADGKEIDSDIDGDYTVSPNNKDMFMFTVVPVENAEYKMDDGEWQDSNVFDLLAPESSHSFYIRYKESENYNAGVSQMLSLVLYKINRQDCPILAVDVSGNSGDRTVEIQAVDGAEYSFDGGKTWSDNNILTGVDAWELNCAIRYKETAVYKASDVASLAVDTTKTSQDAPDVFEIEFTLNPDGKTFTATIPAVENGLYSFDGVNYSESNIKTDCLPDTVYMAYVKFAETADYLESVPAVCEMKSPTIEEAIEDYMLGDVNGNGEIDSMDYILLKRAYFGTFNLDEDATKRADLTKNNEIDSMDYILLKRAYFGTYIIK